MKAFLKGITLVEVLIVVSIVAILAAIAIPNIVGNSSSRREEFLKACAAEGTGPVTCQALWDSSRHRRYRY